MSRTKDRKIKRLQKLGIWSVILEMVITELVIFSLTVFICVLSLFGIINTLILNNSKECRTIVEYVNQNWGKESREELEKMLQNYTNSYSDINGIYLDEHNDILSMFPNLKHSYDDETKNILKTVGTVHFIDNTYDHQFENMLLLDDGAGSYNAQRAILFNPKKMMRTFNVFDLLKNNEFIDWAEKESIGLHTISIHRTKIPNLNIGIRSVYKVNTFQFNLIGTIVIFFLVVLIFSGIYEITKLVNLIHRRKRINLLVTTDTVTGGYNKDYFMQKADKAIRSNKRNLALVQLRLEKYRNFCTAYGLKQGENLLEEINNILIDLLDKKEFVAHVEKSDFVMLLNYQNKETLEIRVRNMMNLLRERRGSQHLTFSAGICPVISREDDIASLLTCAGIAIPKTLKIQDEIVWFNDSMKEEQVWERRIEDDMEKALENHEFQVYLQPKYSTKKEKLSAAEALVRWVHPVLGFVSPGKFIPIFEKNGFILQLDDYMLSEVSKLQAEWAGQGKKLVPISVNVSRAHFAEDNLAEHICSIVDKYKVPHEYIELELTESAFFDDKAVLLTTVRKLKEFGFKVSMDDFGAGYSSLNSLKELPLDIIKLDAEFFRSVDDVERSNLIVGQTISLAKKLGMEIVAEGIETREQVDFLANQDCDLIQGFYFSKPLPVPEFEERAFKE